MNNKDDLFQLIQSMSKSEKRYFKLNTKKGGDKTNNYLQLFDAMNSMENYDESKIRKKFKGTKFIKHLAQEKKYLYDAILKSMRNYNSEKSSLAQIKDGLLDAKYLYERGLNEQSYKALKRVKKIATQYEDYIALIEVNMRERVLIADKKMNSYQNDIESLIKENNEALELLQHEVTYSDLYFRLLVLISKHYKINDIGGQQQLRELFPKNLEEKLQTIKSSKIRRRIFQNLAFYNQLIGNNKEYLFYYQKVFHWWADNDQFKRENALRYRVDLSNLIQASFHLGKLDDIPLFLEKLEAEDPQNSQEKNILFQKVAINKLGYFLNTAKLNEAEEYIPSIENGLNKHNINPASKKVLIANIGIVFFFLEKFKESSKWLNKIINDKKTDNRKDSQFTVRLLNLICLYELEELDLLELQLRASYRFFQQNSNSTNFETLVLKELKTIFFGPPSQKNKYMRNCIEFLNKNVSEENHEVKYGYIELLSWLRSKVENKRIHTILKEAILETHSLK